MEQPEGNYFDKYNNSNIIVKKMMHGFFNSIKKMLALTEYTNILEAGCGEGYVSNFVYSNGSSVKMDAFDISERVINDAKKNFKGINFYTGSIYEINKPDNNYDLVICSEVMEHMDTPDRAFKELTRVCKNYLLISVPNEPIWRILNVCRLKYIKDFGNTPGHINHWSKNDFVNMCSKYGMVIKVMSPLPWTMVLLKIS
ncbi:MAG: class I SAM-dependent methyltransferase [Clostridia bacterium]|jgi:2-polyprenyl-3-methyl-5-hydroxy-6-metoxy-1,4-benzoquinol methylase|nr:class I SAM-dependent methyltransferase [Clostridia bacterium]